MKKILCFILTMLMLMPVCNISAVQAENTELSQKFYDYCVEALPEDMQPAEDDNVTINLEYEIDGVTFFSAESWVTEYADVICKFGDTYIYTRAKRQPYELGIYVANGDEIYTLEEAYNSALITDVSVLEDAFCGWYVFYEDYVPNPENKYESDIVQKVFSPGSWSQDVFDITYKEVFEYFADTNASFDEATPNYALIYVRVPMVTDAPEAYIFGDYVLQSMSGYTPFSFGYCIYIPATGEVYSLIKAYKMGIDGIEKVFTETNIGRRLGDMDKDRKITVKDATYIQKIVAGFEGYSHGGIYTANFDESLPGAIADFNRDRETNIKDATAIQKYIAGITE